MNSRHFITLACAILLTVVLMAPLAGGFTDDGFIHIQYARNLITRGEYSFNAGEVSYGTTSPLWVLVQAALGRILGADETLIATSRVCSWLGGIACVILVFLLGRSAGLSLLFAVLCAFVLAAHAWFVRWTALGMETSSAVLAITAVGLASVRAPADPRQAMRLGFFMAIAALMRPEAYLLAPVYILTIVVARPRRWGCVVRTAAVYAVMMLPWVLFAGVHIGKYLPNTAGAKSGGLVLNPLEVFTNLRPIAKISGSTEGLLIVAVIAAVIVQRRRARVFGGDRLLMLLWVVALPLAYALFDIQVLSRYMLLTTPFAIVLGFVSLEDLVGARRSQIRTYVGVATAIVVIALNIGFYLRVVLPPSRAFSYDLTHNLKDLALFVRDNSSADAIVAAADIGYLAFYSDRYVLDLGGLVLDSTKRLREEASYEDIVDEGLYLDMPEYPRVDFFIDRVHTANRFEGRVLRGYRFESLMVATVGNLGIRKPGTFYYTLYRLHPESNP